MFNDYPREKSRCIYESKQGKGLKYELLNKCFKNSESLLNEIWQIAYSLYRSKEITKIVYNDIIKSIKV